MTNYIVIVNGTSIPCIKASTAAAEARLWYELGATVAIIDLTEEMRE